MIWTMGEFASGGLVPDLTLVIDVEPRVGLARVGSEPDLVESRSYAFHEAVRRGYHRIVDEGRMNARLIEAVGSRSKTGRTSSGTMRTLSMSLSAI